MVSGVHIDYRECTFYFPKEERREVDLFQHGITAEVFEGREKIGEFEIMKYDMWRAKQSGLADKELYDESTIIPDLEDFARMEDYPEGEYFYDRINAYLGEADCAYRDFLWIKWMMIEPAYRKMGYGKLILGELAQRFYGIWLCAILPVQAGIEWMEDDFEIAPEKYVEFPSDLDLAMMKICGHLTNLGFENIPGCNIYLARSSDLIDI